MNKYYLEKLKELKIMDDDFARIVFKDERCAKTVLETLGVIDDYSDIRHYETQYDIKHINGKSLIYDVFVVTDESAIDIEFENSIKNANPLRVRYYLSAMDTHMSKSGVSYDNLPHIILVLICSFDYYKESKPIYTIKRKVKELDSDYDDKSKILIVNGAYQGHDDIGKLVHDLKCTDPNDMHNPVLRQRVSYLKDDTGGVKEMCKIWDEIKEMGKEEGIAEGQMKGKIEGEYNSNLKSLKNIMLKLNIDLKEAMNMLDISLEEYDRYASVLTK